MKTKSQPQRAGEPKAAGAAGFAIDQSVIAARSRVQTAKTCMKAAKKAEKAAKKNLKAARKALKAAKRLAEKSAIKAKLGSTSVIVGLTPASGGKGAEKKTADQRKRATSPKAKLSKVPIIGKGMKTEQSSPGLPVETKPGTGSVSDNLESRLSLPEAKAAPAPGKTIPPPAVSRAVAAPVGKPAGPATPSQLRPIMKAGSATPPTAKVVVPKASVVAAPVVPVTKPNLAL